MRCVIGGGDRLNWPLGIVVLSLQHMIRTTLSCAALCVASQCQLGQINWIKINLV